ncbi:zinc finger protein 521 isoform X2 [Drosophila eugracilis]|uniref:zinc finger protein 521 isoform X2 n=1 Tax=Drosophila eugracilis TaxID=29029 RepID=UPI0007E69EBF|nr:zinc finger protein 521 isoform X2 [Drosophila eugracilis]
MEFSTDLNGFDEDSIEPCRTCGIYFTMGLDMDKAIVKPIFDLDDSTVDGMADILEQLSAWNVKIARGDGRPQYMCIACISEFHRLIKFKRGCLETQEQFGELEYQREHIVIKREIEQEDQKFCGFIYLDTDEEEISDEDGSRRVCAPFDIPHVPIKEEHMARVPVQTSSQFQLPEPKEFALPVESGFDMMDNDPLTSSMFAPSSEDASGTADDEEEDEIIRFTYDDDGDPTAPLPAPVYSPVVSCKLCLHDSSDQEAHLDHMRRIHLLKDWECHICAKKFTNTQESRIKFHLKYHKLQQHIKCPVCGFICNSKDTLKEHRQLVHARTKCSYCGKTVKNTMLQTHLKQHLKGEAELAQKLKVLEQFPIKVSPTKAFSSSLPSISEPTLPEDTCIIQCAFCSKTFEEAQQLQAHVLATHKKTSKRPRSPENTLPIKMTRKKILSSPEETEQPSTDHAESDSQEDSCDEKVDENISEVSLNGRSSTKQVPEKCYISCHICGKFFDLKIKLNRHLKQHKSVPHKTF